jgi:hypothetical protein
VVDSFWLANPDLQEGPARKYLNFKVREVEAANPDKSFKEILDMTEAAVRADLKLEKQAKGVEAARVEKKSEKPTFASAPRGSSRATSPQKREGQLAQIDELIDL